MSVSRRLRFEVLNRDHFTCFYCGRRPPRVTLEIEHKIPRSRGGEDSLGNLVAACWDCNRGKGTTGLGTQEQAYSLMEWAQDQIEDQFGLDDELPEWFFPACPPPCVFSDRYLFECCSDLAPASLQFAYIEVPF